jgi:hypothetical protein
MHLYTRPEEPSDRETRIFFVLRAGPNLNGAYGAAGNRTPTAAYEPFRRHGPRGVPSGRGSPSGRGLPSLPRPPPRHRRGTVVTV